MFVLDSHCDTPSEIYRGRDIGLDNKSGHIDIPKLERSQVDGAFFALYIPADMDSEPDRAFRYAGELLESVKESVSRYPYLAFATSQEIALENKSKGLFSVFLGLENASPIGCGPEAFERLRWFYDNGIRYVTLCHSGDNEICDSCASVNPRWGGLSPFGHDVVAQMNNMGMLVDVSHISDSSFYDVLECSSKPVVATHSCCRALADHPRNMTDDMIRSLAAARGVLQVNFYPVFLDADYRSKMPSFRRIADHIDHIVDIAGIDFVGIGSDFDGIELTPAGIQDISMMPRIFEELSLRGYSDADIAKIASGNFFRVMSENQA